MSRNFDDEDYGVTGRVLFNVCICCTCLIAVTALVVGSIALNTANHIVVPTPAPPAAVAGVQHYDPKPQRVNLQSESVRAALLHNAAASSGKKVEQKRNVDNDEELPPLVPADKGVRVGAKSNTYNNKKKPQKRIVTLKDRLRQQ